MSGSFKTQLHENIRRGTLTEGEGSVRLTSFLDQLPLVVKNIFYYFTKQRRSTVLSLPLQYGFSGLAQVSSRLGLLSDQSYYKWP